MKIKILLSLIITIILWISLTYWDYSENLFNSWDPAWAPSLNALIDIKDAEKYDVISWNGRECSSEDIDWSYSYYYPTGTWWTSLLWKSFDNSQASISAYSIYDIISPEFFNPNLRKKGDELCISYDYKKNVLVSGRWGTDWQTLSDKYSQKIKPIWEIVPPAPDHVIVASHKPIEKANLNEDLNIYVSVDQAWKWNQEPSIKLYWRKNIFEKQDAWYNAPYIDWCSVFDGSWACLYLNNGWTKIDMQLVTNAYYSEDMKNTWKFNLYNAQVPVVWNLFFPFEYYIEIEVNQANKIYFPDQSFIAWNWSWALWWYKTNFYNLDFISSWSALYGQRDTSIKWKKIDTWTWNPVAWYIIYWSKWDLINWFNASKQYWNSSFEYSINASSRQVSHSFSWSDLSKEWETASGYVVYNPPVKTWSWMAYRTLQDWELHWMEKMKDYREIRVVGNITQEFYVKSDDANLIDDPDLDIESPYEMKRYKYCQKTNMPLVTCTNNVCTENCSESQVTYYDGKYDPVKEILYLNDNLDTHPLMSQMFKTFPNKLKSVWERFSQYDYRWDNITPAFIYDTAFVWPRSSTLITSSNSRFVSNPSVWAISAYFADKACNIYFHWDGKLWEYDFEDEHWRKITIGTSKPWSASCAWVDISYDINSKAYIDSSKAIRLYWLDTWLKLEDQDVSGNNIIINTKKQLDKWISRSKWEDSVYALISDNNKGTFSDWISTFTDSISNSINNILNFESQRSESEKLLSDSLDDWSDLIWIQNVIVEIFDDNRHHLFTASMQDWIIKYKWNSRLDNVWNWMLSKTWNSLLNNFDTSFWIMKSVWDLDENAVSSVVYNFLFSSFDKQKCITSKGSELACNKVWLGMFVDVIWAWEYISQFMSESIVDKILNLVDMNISFWDKEYDLWNRKWKSFISWWSGMWDSEKILDIGGGIRQVKSLWESVSDIAINSLIDDLDITKTGSSLLDDIFNLISSINKLSFWKDLDLTDILNFASENSNDSGRLISKIWSVALAKIIIDNWGVWTSIDNYMNDLWLEFEVFRIEKQNLKAALKYNFNPRQLKFFEVKNKLFIKKQMLTEDSMWNILVLKNLKKLNSNQGDYVYLPSVKISIRKNNPLIALRDDSSFRDWFGHISSIDRMMDNVWELFSKTGILVIDESELTDKQRSDILSLSPSFDFDSLNNISINPNFEVGSVISILEIFNDFDFTLLETLSDINKFRIEDMAKIINSLKLRELPEIYNLILDLETLSLNHTFSVRFLADDNVLADFDNIISDFLNIQNENSNIDFNIKYISEIMKKSEVRKLTEDYGIQANYFWLWAFEPIKILDEILSVTGVDINKVSNYIQAAKSQKEKLHEAYGIIKNHVEIYWSPNMKSIIWRVFKSQNYWVFSKSQRVEIVKLAENYLEKKRSIEEHLQKIEYKTNAKKLLADIRWISSSSIIWAVTVERLDAELVFYIENNKDFALISGLTKKQAKDVWWFFTEFSDIPALRWVLVIINWKKWDKNLLSDSSYIRDNYVFNSKRDEFNLLKDELSLYVSRQYDELIELLTHIDEEASSDALRKSKLNMLKKLYFDKFTEKEGQYDYFISLKDGDSSLYNEKWENHAVKIKKALDIAFHLREKWIENFNDLLFVSDFDVWDRFREF